LAGLAETAPVVGDDPVARFQQDALLLLPRMPVQWIPVDEHHRLTRAVILVVDVDIGVVLLTDGDLGHGSTSLGLTGRTDACAGGVPSRASAGNELVDGGG